MGQEQSDVLAAIRRQRRTQRGLSSPSSLRASSPRIQRTELCKRCKRLRLDTVLKRRHLTKIGKPVRRLGFVQTWRIDSCPFCHLMLQMLPANANRSSSHELRSFSSNKILERGWQAVDITMLAIDYRLNSAFLINQPKKSGLVRIIQPKIDIRVVNKWLQYCQDNHSNACSGEDSTPLSVSSRFPSLSIPSFRLIDCETRQIVKGSDQRYVALSYVWGQGENGGKFSWTLPDPVPDTIQDAITLTCALHLRYLWIDRYCINQQDSEEVLEQVAQMDLIYNCAYLTIIAAAGDGPNHGLPGIGKRLRSSQPHAKIGQHQFVSTLPDPAPAIESSKWSQRGWTYQEGLLSRRRLIFVDEQLYFECSGMYCCEALNLPLRGLHTQNGEHFKAPYCNGVNIGIFPNQTTTSPWEIVRRIEHYTQRQLTNSDDILKAMSGILRAFEKRKRPVLHCAGVPMIPAPPKKAKSERIDYIDEPKEWSPAAGFYLGLCWGLKSPSPRREGFPSWSWTGWKGEVWWRLDDWRKQLFQPNEDLRASIQLQDGKVVDWKNFCESYAKISPTISMTLHLAGWGTQIQVVKTRAAWYNKSNCEAIIELEKRGPCEWSFQLLSTTPRTECIGIDIGHTRDQMSRIVYLLVVQEISPGLYERVGFGEVTSNVREVHKPGKGSFSSLASPESPEPGLKFWLPLPVLKRSWQHFQLC